MAWTMANRAERVGQTSTVIADSMPVVATTPAAARGGALLRYPRLPARYSLPPVSSTPTAVVKAVGRKRKSNTTSYQLKARPTTGGGEGEWREGGSTIGWADDDMAIGDLQCYRSVDP